jgi:hypothetical protein
MRKELLNKLSTYARSAWRRHCFRRPLPRTVKKGLVYSTTTGRGHTSPTAGVMACFLGVCVCATGITSREEKTIQQTSADLGIKYCTNFNSHVTHLIVKKAGSDKHAVSSLHLSFALPHRLLVGTKTKYLLCGNEMALGLQVTSPSPLLYCLTAPSLFAP